MSTKSTGGEGGRELIINKMLMGGGGLQVQRGVSKMAAAPSLSDQWWGQGLITDSLLNQSVAGGRATEAHQPIRGGDTGLSPWKWSALQSAHKSAACVLDLSRPLAIVSKAAQIQPFKCSVTAIILFTVYTCRVLLITQMCPFHKENNSELNKADLDSTPSISQALSSICAIIIKVNLNHVKITLQEDFKTISLCPPPALPSTGEETLTKKTRNVIIST